MSEMTFDKLCSKVLKATYYAEQQITEALPKMIEAASSPELKQAFSQHLQETQGHVQRLEQVFAAMGQEPDAEKCPIINAMIDTCETMIKKSEAGPVRDAALIFCGQSVEHYEMAHYGTMIAWAKAAGKTQIATLFEQTLKEEKNADSILNECAHASINEEAAQYREAA